MHQLLQNLQQSMQEMDLWLQALITFLISMIPVIELRGAIPVAAYAGLPWFVALPVALTGNLFPVPFILLFIRNIFRWLKDHTPLGGLVRRLEKRAGAKMHRIRKFEVMGLVLFVGVPLPGTGAWSGALIAALMNLRLRLALPSIALGVLIAGIIMTLISYGFVAVMA